MPKVLLAYDGSTASAAAVRVAGALVPGAHTLVATVPAPVDARLETVLYAAPTLRPEVVERTLGELHADTRERAAEIARGGVEQARAAGLEAEVVPVPDRVPAWETLLAVAHAEGVDALVCGTRGRGGFARALLGSTSSGLLHHAALPLLVAPDGAGALDGPAIVAYDGSPAADRAITAAGTLFPGRAAIVVHVWESQYRRGLTARALAGGPVDDVREIVEVLDGALAEDAARCAARGVELARAAGLDATAEPLESSTGVWRTITALARSRGAAVIVTGARGLGGARSALLGSVSSGLVHNSELPVLVASPGD